MSIGEGMIERESGINKEVYVENPCKDCEIDDCKSPDCPLEKLFPESEKK